MTPQMDRRVEVPTDKVAFFEFVGLEFDAGIVLQDELKEGRRTSLDKIDRYFYETISRLLRNNGSPYLPFK